MSSKTTTHHFFMSTPGLEGDSETQAPRKRAHFVE